MLNLSRRQFFARSAAGLTAAGYLSNGALELRAAPLGLPIGCQVFPIREQLTADFAGTLKEIAGVGYRVIEFCSPPSFVKMGFASFVGMKASEIRDKITGAGLQVVSCHFQFTELKEHLDERIEFAQELGLKQMVVATIPLWRRDATMAEWLQAADEMNKLGEQTHKAGIQLGYHNHHIEFEKIDGVLIFDELMSRFDKKLVKSQFQVADAMRLGYDPVTFLTKYPGRFLSLHLQDWLIAEKKNVPIGQGSIDWRKIFSAAGKSHIKNYFVEMDMEALKASYGYLQGLKV